MIKLDLAFEKKVKNDFDTFFSIFGLQQEREKGQLLEANHSSVFHRPDAIHHLHETFTHQVEKEFV